MKINSLQKHRDDAELRVSQKFYPTSQDTAHATKRAIALSDIDTNEFIQAAEIEGMTTQQLREVILSKPDTIMEKENTRRRIVLDIRNATTKSEIDDVLNAAGIPKKLL